MSHIALRVCLSMVSVMYIVATIFIGNDTEHCHSFPQNAQSLHTTILSSISAWIKLSAIQSLNWNSTMIAHLFCGAICHACIYKDNCELHAAALSTEDYNNKTTWYPDCCQSGIHSVLIDEVYQTFFQQLINNNNSNEMFMRLIGIIINN